MGWHRVVVAAGMVGVVTTLLSGCSLAPVSAGPVQSPHPHDPIAAARSLAGTPALVRESREPSCGEYALGQGETLPEAARTCLGQAVDDHVDAALAWSHPTTEGDPVIAFAFVRAGEPDVLVSETSAFDSYGGAGDPWSWSRCTVPAEVGVRYEHCSETTEP